MRTSNRKSLSVTCSNRLIAVFSSEPVCKVSSVGRLGLVELHAVVLSC